MDKHISESFIIRAKNFKENKMSTNKGFLKYISKFQHNRLSGKHYKNNVMTSKDGHQILLRHVISSM